MKKGILAVLCIAFVYCILNLFVVHETLIQIEHKEPLHIISQNALHINTENNENGYITDIILPSKIFYTHAHIEIKSDVIQNIAIKFSGKKEAYKDTYKKYTVGYRKIRINTKDIAKFITASYVKPFSCTMENLTAAEIDFKYKTNFVSRNMSINYLIGALVILIVTLAYMLCLSSFGYNIYSAGRTMISSKDCLLTCIEKYKNMQKEYKITFWVNFIVLNIVYLYLNMNFLFGNHDWPYLREDLLTGYARVGRFSISMINVLTEFKYLPVVNNCLAFAFLSLTPIFLVKYWKLPVTKFNIFAVSVPLLLHPQLLGVMYFLHLSYAYFLVPLLLVIGLILSEKKNNKISILSVLLFVLAFGDYNICINTLAVIFLGKMFLEYANGNSFITLFKKYFRTICIILLSCLVYFLIVQYLKYAGVIIDFYNTALLPAEKILPRTADIFVNSFKHFYITYPFVDLRYLIVLSLLFVPALMIIIFETMKKKSIVYLLGSLFIFIVLVFSSKIVYCVTASNVSLEAYLYYFSLPFIYTCAIAYILNTGKLWSRNLLFFLLIPVCYMSILRDFECQKYWKIGLDGDKQTISRLVDKIEEQEEFQYDKEYDLFSIGFYNSFNSYYYPEKTAKSNHIIGHPFFASYKIRTINHFMPRTKFKSILLSGINTPYEEIRVMLAGIPQEKIMHLKPWPHKNSVLVYEDKIIVCWREKELSYVKKALAEKE